MTTDSATLPVGLPGAPAATALAAIGAAVREYEISTCTLSDVLDGLGVPNCVLDPGLRRLTGGTGMFFGAALPVSWVVVRKGAHITDPSPSTWSQVRDFIVPEVTDGRGQVYVAGCGPLVTSAALAGGMSVTYLLHQLGFEGVVLGGAVRDRAVIEETGRPVVASNFVPADTQGAFRVESVGQACLIGATVVRSGDWVFSDGNGTVVVPSALLDQVLPAAIATERTERQVLRRIRAGERLPRLIDEVGQI
jgi:regulator of RNase E activity RraA